MASTRRAARLRPSSRRANVAITSPWKESMKHTRNTASPTWVTRGFVEAGETSGTPLAWATTAASRVLADEHSPTRATTWSLEMSFFAAVADSPASDRSSSTTSSIRRPSTPPEPLTSSTAIRAPSSEASPKEASRPVIDMKKPILIGSAAQTAGTEPSRRSPKRKKVHLEILVRPRVIGYTRYARSGPKQSRNPRGRLLRLCIGPVFLFSQAPCKAPKSSGVGP